MPKILVAFYSLTGNARSLGESASSILAQRGYASRALEAKLCRPAGFVKCVAMTVLGLPMPVRDFDIGDSDFDVVAVGGPVWAGTLSPPTAALVSRLGDKGLLRGKKVVPFLTFAMSVGRAPLVMSRCISSQGGIPCEPVAARFAGSRPSREEVIGRAGELADAVVAAARTPSEERSRA